MRMVCATLAMLLLGTTAQAQSFNCSYARSPAEVAICQDGDLAMLDQTMAAGYFRLENNLPYALAAQLQREQLAWLSDRDTCGYDFACLRVSYDERIVQLCQWSWYLGNNQPCRMAPLE